MRIHEDPGGDAALMKDFVGCVPHRFISFFITVNRHHDFMERQVCLFHDAFETILPQILILSVSYNKDADSRPQVVIWFRGGPSIAC